MHWLGASRVNNGHSGIPVSCQTTDIIFFFCRKVRHSTVCWQCLRTIISAFLGVTGGTCLVPLMEVADGMITGGGDQGRERGGWQVITHKYRGSQQFSRVEYLTQIY